MVFTYLEFFCNPRTSFKAFRYLGGCGGSVTVTKLCKLNFLKASSKLKTFLRRFKGNSLLKPTTTTSDRANWIKKFNIDQHANVQESSNPRFQIESQIKDFITVIKVSNFYYPFHVSIILSMFLLSFPCFYYTFYVLSILSMIPVSFLWFQYPFYVSTILSMFPLYFLCFYYPF